MYKSRITKWGLDKKFKAKERKAIARKKVSRDACGKASIIKIRGQEVDEIDVMRYFKRRQIKTLEEVVAKEGLVDTGTPSDIDVSTPVPLPTTDSNEDSSFNYTKRPRIGHSSTNSGTSLVSRTRHDRSNRLSQQSYNYFGLLSCIYDLPQSPTSPSELLIPESIFTAIRDLYRGNLDGHTWQNDNDGYLVPRNARACSPSGVYAINDFNECCEVAISFLQQGLFVEARQMLSQACEKSRAILEEGHARTIPLIFDIYFRFEHAGFATAALMIFEYLRSVAKRKPHIGQSQRAIIDKMLLLDQNRDEVYYYLFITPI